MRLYAAIIALALSALACMEPIATPTPLPSPTASATPTPTLRPTATATAFTDTVLGVHAIVLPSAVNIRETADGIATNKYLYAGDKVFVLGCLGNWCLIEAVISGETVVGHVYRGCLSSVAENRMCEAK